MATINLFTVPCRQRDVRISVYEPSQLDQVSLGNKMMRSLVSWMSHTFPSCFGSEDVVADIEDNDAIRAQVSHSSTIIYDNPMPLKDEHDSYVYSLAPAADELPLQFKWNPHGSAFTAYSTRTEAKKIVVSAGLVSKVVCAIVATEGEMADTDANRSVIGRAARKVMRDANFRHEVIRVHLAHVIDAYFACREHHEKAGRARHRLPAWLLRACGFRDDVSKTQ